MTYVESASRIIVEIDVIDLVRLIVVSGDDNVAQEDPGDVALQITLGGHLELVITSVRPEHFGAEFTAKHHVTFLLLDGGYVPRP